MPKRWTYIVAYDSPNSNRRNRMLARIAGFGIDPQLSFHECRLSTGERRELWAELIACADPEQDRLLLLRLDPRSSKWRLSEPAPNRVASPLIYVG